MFSSHTAFWSCKLETGKRGVRRQRYYLHFDTEETLKFVSYVFIYLFIYFTVIPKILGSLGIPPLSVSIG